MTLEHLHQNFPGFKENPRPRDRQRSKLYAAEYFCFGKYKEEFKDWEKMVKFIHGVLSNRHVAKKYPKAVRLMSGEEEFRIRKGPGSRFPYVFMVPNGVYHTNLVTFPRRYRNKQTILHELAHILTADNVESHGREFCKTYLYLTLIILGRETERKLKQSMKKANCKYGKAHSPWSGPITPEQKEMLKHRLNGIKDSESRNQ